MELFQLFLFSSFLPYSYLLNLIYIFKSIS